MKSNSSQASRRSFLKGSAILGTGIGLASIPQMGSAHTSPTYSEDDLYLMGPQKGYSLHVGTLLSTMTMMRSWIVDQVEGLTTEQLDFQIAADQGNWKKGKEEQSLLQTKQQQEETQKSLAEKANVLLR